MRKTIFVGGLFPFENKTEIINNSKGPIQFAADILQWNIVKGLENFYSDLKIINALYIGSYPFLYKKMFIPQEVFSYGKIKDNINVGFINIPLFKNFSRYKSIKEQLLKDITEDNNSVIFVYAMHTAFMKAVVDVKKKYPTTKLCLIVPDLPDYMDDNPGFLKRTLKKFDKKQQNSILDNFDLYVLLSKFMVEKLAVDESKCVIVEGIYGNEVHKNINIEKTDKFVILYTGTLARRYGIVDLLNAFKILEYENLELWICGDGDGRKDVEMLASVDKRIKYFGQVPHSEILTMQKKASLLVNPRKNESEYTKYSFPSKTMEYLASATPTLMYPLQGIPKEYFNFCYIIDTEKGEDIAIKIKEIYNLSEEERLHMGLNAQKFILENKNPKSQVQKIITKLNKITN